MEKEYGFVVLTGILSGGIIFGVQIFANLGLSLYQISVFHVLFIFLLLPFVLFKKECRIKKEMLRLFIIFGFLESLTVFTEFGPIILGVPVAIVVLLLYTQPLWTTILGRLFLKESITKRKILAVVIVLVGAVFLINPLTATTTGRLTGIILALIGGALLSAWVILGRKAGLRRYNPVTTKFGYTVFMLFFIILFYPVVSMFIREPTITSLSFNLPVEVWFYLMIFSIFAIILPHILYFEGVKKVPASTAGIILMLEPVSASILAAVFLQQAITPNILVGGALILVANYLVIRK